MRKWTVMAYMAGDNDLTEEMLWSIKEMKRSKVGPDQPVTVVVLYDPGFNMPAQEYVINSLTSAGDQDGRLYREARSNGVAEPNMGNIRTLADFVGSCINDYPAERYMLVLSGHSASSMDRMFIRYVKSERKPEIPKIDLIGFDACMMTTAEVAYELRDYFKFMLGSQGYALSAGWPYKRMLDCLLQEVDSQSRVVVEKLVEAYTAYYSDFALSGHSLDFGGCDLSQIEPLKDAVGGLTKVLNKAVRPGGQGFIGSSPGLTIGETLVLSHWLAQSFNQDQYVDLFDFCDILSQYCRRNGSSRQWTKIASACGEVLDLEKRLVVRSCYTGPVCQHSRGMSIYFPWSWVSYMYRYLSFGKPRKGANWRRFLINYVHSTRRPMKGQRIAGLNPLLSQVFNLDYHMVGKREEERFWAGGGFNNIFSTLGLRDSPPNSKGYEGSAFSMKNPPVDWVPCDCGRTRVV
ncbi:MAG TPA: clostripain-related cysteine peptidase [Acidobacteriota bacterium]|nr:clostripain-related cysteine peptidase [Acidobacteriota bacterium]